MNIRVLPEQAVWRFDRSRSEGSAPPECAQAEPFSNKVPVSVHKQNLYFDGKSCYIQGPHDKLAQKEFLSHTLKNKVFFLIFLVFHDNNI